MKTPLLPQTQKRSLRNFCVQFLSIFLFGAGLYFLLNRLHQQNDLEELRSFMEVPLAVTGRQMLALHFPEALKLCDRKTEIDLNDASPPIRIKFMEPISAGQFGAILKIQAEGEEIAFKMPALDSEVAIMRTLIGSGMEELPLLKLGGVIHRFSLVEDASENLLIHMKGFGMEYINFPTLYEYMGMEAIGKTLAERKQFLFTEPIRKLFRQGIRAMLKMWSVGVIHQDLHANNILVDIQTKKIKIIDFGKAVVPGPTGSQEVRFRLGTRSDYMRYGLSFISTLLFAEAFDTSSESPSNAEICEAQNCLKQFDPDAAIPFTTGDYPQIPEYKAVYDEFRRKHGITGPPAETTYPFARPPPRNVAPGAMRPPSSSSSDDAPPLPIERAERGSPSQTYLENPDQLSRGTGSSPGSFHSLDLGALEVDESNFSSGTRKELEVSRKRQESMNPRPEASSTSGSMNPQPQAPSSSGERNVGVRRREYEIDLNKLKNNLFKRKELEASKKRQESMNPRPEASSTSGSMNPQPQAPSSSGERNVGVQRREYEIDALQSHDCSQSDCQVDIAMPRRRLPNRFREKCRAYCKQMSGSFAGIRSYSSASMNVVRDCSHQHLIEDWICEDCLNKGERCFAWSKSGECTQIKSGMTCLLEGESINPDGTRNKLTDNAIPLTGSTEAGLPIVPLPNQISDEQAPLTRASNLASLLENSEDAESSSMPNAFHSGLESYLPVARASPISENTSSSTEMTSKNRPQSATVDRQGLLQPNAIFSHE